MERNSTHFGHILGQLANLSYGQTFQLLYFMAQSMFGAALCGLVLFSRWVKYAQMYISINWLKITPNILFYAIDLLC